MSIEDLNEKLIMNIEDLIDVLEGLKKEGFDNFEFTIDGEKDIEDIYFEEFRLLKGLDKVYMVFRRSEG